MVNTLAKTSYECWEFYGTGDQFFGGNADDRVLHSVNGTPKFVRSCEVQRLGAVRMAFDSQEEAETAGIAATERRGLISGMKA